MPVQQQDSPRPSIEHKPDSTQQYDGPTSPTTDIVVAQAPGRGQRYSSDNNISSAQQAGTQGASIPPDGILTSVRSDQQPSAICIESKKEGSVSDLVVKPRPTTLRTLDVYWMPYTLKWPYMLMLVFLSLLFGAVISVLTWYSMVHNGLGPDTNSTALLFG
jgi:hypothetical protein